jgi:hypothetical protein
MAHVVEPSAPRRPAGRERDDDGASMMLVERVIAAAERNWLSVLVVLLLVDAVLLLYLGHGLSFFYDDWNYVTEDFGGGIHSLLRAHNGHASLFPVAIYKILFHLVGLNHYAVFRLVVIALHLTCAVLVFVLTSRRMQRVPALLAASLILFLGVAWEDLLWAFQISFMLSIAGGLAAWVLLERRDRFGDIGAMLAVLVSLGSSGLGIPVAIGVAVELGWRREWRRGFVVAVPVLLYLLWYLHYGEDEITQNGLINAPGFAEDMAAAAFGGLFGRALEWGRPIALVCSLVLLRQLAYSRAITARLAGLLATALSLWLLTAAARSTISAPETSRYVYLGAVVIVLITVELLQGKLIAPRITGVAAVVVVLAAITGLTTLHSGALSLRGDSTVVTAELGALELAAAHAPPGYQPDPVHAPQILAGPYLHTVRAIGSSPADTPAEIAAAEPASRAAADAVLVALDALTLGSLGHTELSPLAPAPAITALVSGVQTQRGACVDLTPLYGTTTVVTMTLPGGGVAIYDHGAGSVAAAVRRFGEAFIPLSTEIAPRSDAVLAIPPDAAQVPWELQLTSSSALSACGLEP